MEEILNQKNLSYWRGLSEIVEQNLADQPHHFRVPRKPSNRVKARGQRHHSSVGDSPVGRPKSEYSAVAGRHTLAQRDEAEKIRSSLTKTVYEMLKDGTILCAPTTPDVAPLRGHADISEVRLPLLRLTALAGLSGLPAVNVPLWKCDNIPFGVSFIAGRNRDEDLLALAAKVSVGLTTGF
jgi:Asp-tRNA(Asn)/Glu-tRNA(Gln) amidotransferase A subunit family amidase